MFLFAADRAPQLYDTLLEKVVLAQNELRAQQLIDAIAIAVASGDAAARESSEAATLNSLASRTGINMKGITKILSRERERYTSMAKMWREAGANEQLSLRVDAYRSLDSFRLRTVAFAEVVRAALAGRLKAG
jgi:hypothetical protein